LGGSDKAKLPLLQLRLRVIFYQQTPADKWKVQMANDNGKRQKEKGQTPKSKNKKQKTIGQIGK
jgi:hypothetical protein